MDTRVPINSTLSSLIPSTSFEDSIIFLIPCEYDPVEGYGSLSEDSIDSSEVIESSEDEIGIIKIDEIHAINEVSISNDLDGINEKLL